MTTLNAFKDGKEHGPWEYYHENGQLKYKVTYVEGREHGLWEHYLPDGQLSEKGTHNMGERCGEWTFLSGAKHYPPCPEDPLLPDNDPFGGSSPGDIGAAAVLDYHSPSVAGGLMVGVVVILIIMMVFDWLYTTDYISLASDFSAGRPWSYDRVSALGSRVDSLSGIFSIVWLIGLLACMNWSARIVKAYPALGIQNTKYGVGWATWGWVTPIAFLFVPYGFLSEAWKRTRPISSDSGQADTPDWFPFWWGLWIIGGLAVSLGNSMVSGTGSELDAFSTGLWVGLAGRTGTIVAGVFFLVLLRLLSARVDERRGEVLQAARELSGPYEEYYDDGQLKEKGTQKDDKRDGLFERFYANGQPDQRGSFKDGELEGPFEQYSKDGKLEEKGSFKDGEQCGEWLANGETVNYDPC